MTDVLAIFALQALFPFSVTTLTCCVLVISGVMGVHGLAKGASSGWEGVDICFLALWLTVFSPHPAVVPVNMCIPWLFQPVFNSYFVYTAQGPSHFLFNCLVFFPDVFKLLVKLENRKGKMQQKSVFYLRLAASEAVQRCMWGRLDPLLPPPTMPYYHCQA